MIRGALSAVARNESLGGLLGRTPIARDVVKRLVGGDTVESALEVAAGLADRGFFVSLERATSPAITGTDADQVVVEYLTLIDAVRSSGLSGVCEVVLIAEAMGTEVDPSGARDRLAAVVAHAGSARVPVMFGLGPAADVVTGLRVAEWFVADGRDVGITLPAVLRSTEADCARLASGRVRLVKGGQRPNSPLVHGQAIEIDKAFIRCAKALLRGRGEPSFATHDPRLIEILETLVVRYSRAPRTYEYTFFMGRAESTQERLLDQGERVRIYVPYGPQWFERLVGGLAEQPSTVAAAVRSLLPGS